MDWQISTLVLLGVLAAVRIFAALTSSLNKFPGPLVAKFTDFWRFVDVWNGLHHKTLIRLHQQHGKIVQIGPNLLDLSDPAWIKIIYSTRGEFKKSECYSVQDVILDDGQVIPTGFSIRDNDAHAQIVKPVQRLYNINNIISYEPQIDQVLKLLVRVLDTFTNRQTCDLGRQMLYTAYDIVGSMTNGTTFGYLERQCDFDGTLNTADRIFDYYARCTQMPWLDRFLAKNPILAIRKRFSSFGIMGTYCAQQAAARLQSKDNSSHTHHDFLSDMLEIESQDMTRVISWLMTNVAAGSDTTAIQLRAAIYYTLKSPLVYKKLQAELDAANLSLPPSYQEAKEKLPYLDAIVRESMRLHPGVGLPLERIVPTGGIKLPNGPYLKAGTKIGMTAPVVHMNEEVFGMDPSAFMPERWLQHNGESNTQYKERERRMRDADLTFGAGRRICLGRFVALVEIYKVLPTVFALYDIQLKDPAKEWTVTNSWFMRQEGIEVMLKRRRAGQL
ncbi:MAG: hypothetical protein M1821_008376 [Bathelium mastoideum]|nr:MAG: hypothetical protein M1821_008376 [Bathelium mastoideum]